MYVLSDVSCVLAYDYLMREADREGEDGCVLSVEYVIPYNYKPDERGKERVWDRREQGEGCPLGQLLNVWFLTWFLIGRGERRGEKQGGGERERGMREGAKERGWREMCVSSPTLVKCVGSSMVPYDHKPNERGRKRERWKAESGRTCMYSRTFVVCSCLLLPDERGREKGRKGRMGVSSQTFVEYYVIYKPDERQRERVRSERIRRGRMCVSSPTLVKCVVPYMVLYDYLQRERKRKSGGERRVREREERGERERCGGVEGEREKVCVPSDSC